MGQKIVEKIVEPNKIFVNSVFKLKIKAIRHATYEEIKDKLTYTTLKNYSYNNLRGE